MNRALLIAALLAAACGGGSLGTNENAADALAGGKVDSSPSHRAAVGLVWSYVDQGQTWFAVGCTGALVDGQHVVTIHGCTNLVEKGFSKVPNFVFLCTNSDFKNGTVNPATHPECFVPVAGAVRQKLNPKTGAHALAVITLSTPIAPTTINPFKLPAASAHGVKKNELLKAIAYGATGAGEKIFLKTDGYRRQRTIRVSKVGPSANQQTGLAVDQFETKRYSCANDAGAVALSGRKVVGLLLGPSNNKECAGGTDGYAELAPNLCFLKGAGVAAADCRGAAEAGEAAE
jgi:hypothetical protein